MIMDENNNMTHVLRPMTYKMWCYLAKRWNHRMIHVYDNEINDKDAKKNSHRT